MAGKAAILSVRVVGDAVEAVAALGDVDDAAGRTVSTMDKVAAGASLLEAAIVGVMVATGNAASEMEQAVGGVDAVFKEQADTVHAWADSAATDVGLARDEYSNFATLVGAQLKNMGIPMDEVATKSQWLIETGADLAAQYGGSTADAVSALSSLLRGERDPIERYGVSINQAAVDAQKAAMGLSDLSGEADRNATLQATLALLTTQTADAHGAFAREVDTTAHKQQVANAEWQNAQIALGEAFLPALSAGADLASTFSRFIGDNSEVMSGFIIVVALLAGGIVAAAGAIKAWEVATQVATAAQWLWNVAMSANPLGLIVLAIAAVIAIIVLWVTHWDELSKTVGDFFNSLFGWVGDAIGWVGELFGGLGDLLGISTSAEVSAKVTADTSSLDRIAPMSLMVGAPTARVAGFAAMTSAVASSPTASPLARAGGGAGTVINNTFNVSGAIDPNGTARTIQSTLREFGQRTGQLNPGQSGGDRPW
ncbi:hypothetical protein [Leifsonia sp. WHRI 6310E]|uniref:hypothetical protein n=1 Tax=Leifsonia sp. WHRI 6310E TaxID=3162562 RepID=UPI0032EED242